MARRKSTKMSRIRNIEPAVQTLDFGLNLTVPPLGSQRFHIDISQCASLVNRRFYRQGLNWGVAGFKFLGGGNALILCSKLPNTWIMANAWKKSMSVWSKMNDEALAETETLRPRFLDFKIFSDDEHHLNGFANNLLPPGVQPGEWESSKIFIPNATNAAAATTQDLEIVATGASFTGPGASGLLCVSAIEGYASSRSLPDVLDPNTPADAEDTSGTTPHNWMSAIFNEGNVQMTDVIEELTHENNVAPYPFENGPNQAGGVFTDTMYPNGANQGPAMQTHDVEWITGTTIGQTTRIKGGNFPCGLVKFSILNTSETETLQLQLLLDLIPGSHRGYLAEPMQDM